MSPRHRTKQKRTSILIVDDEPGIVDVLIAVLEDAGHRASGATNGQEGLSRLKASLPDLMLLDVEMPVLDGEETLRALKADPRLAAVPVLMMSGIPESMVKRRCRGYDAFLRKPFSLAELLETVDTLTNGAAPRRRTARPRAKRAPAQKK
ncbi:MAG TPA: response regulator [Polyangiaceae bacterium]|nr:response regulator [Polyangiaceae bacterium]